MKNETISILGCGWLGFPLAQTLVKQGYSVKGATTRQQKFEILQKNKIRPYLLNFTPELQQNQQDFFQSSILIVNIPPRVAHTGPDFHRKQIQNLFSLLKTGQKILFISSSSVFGNQGLVDEQTIPLPSKLSGKVLLEVENYIQKQKQYQITILRLAGLVGPERQPVKFLSGRENLDNGNAPVNLIHREDCIGIIQCIIEQNAWGQIFHGAADNHDPRCKFYPKMARIMGYTPPTFSEQAVTDGKNIINAKVKQDLHYTFRFPDIIPHIANFSFIVPDKLAGMAYPSTNAFQELAGLGIKTIISLSHRLPDSKGFAHYHFSLPDFTRIPSEQMDEVITTIQKSNFPVVVHCEGGIGRTGVVLASFLVAAGKQPWEAIAEIRRKRPGAIDHEELEQSVVDYHKFLESK